jgi:hypothetical protein
MELIGLVDGTKILFYTAPSFLTAMILAKNVNHATRPHHVEGERETCQQVMVAGADRTPVAEYRELSARDGATTVPRDVGTTTPRHRATASAPAATISRDLPILTLGVSYDCGYDAPLFFSRESNPAVRRTFLDPNP